MVQADFAPTVLKEIGALIPEHWRGIPLQEGTKNRKFTYHVQIPYAAVIKYDKDQRTKLMVDYKSNKEFLFNLISDPKELNPSNSLNYDLKQILDDAKLSSFSTSP